MLEALFDVRGVADVDLAQVREGLQDVNVVEFLFTGEPADAPKGGAVAGSLRFGIRSLEPFPNVYGWLAARSSFPRAKAGASCRI